ncbi:IS1 family transposase [Chloroflexota bacterium]
MNKLSIERQAQIIKVLCEGNSIRSTARITDSAVNTVVKLLRDVGNTCLKYQDEVMKDLPCQKLQCDEIWSFVYSKDKNVPEEHTGEFGYGDVWTFTAIDADTKLIPSWLVGERNTDCAYAFVADLRDRLSNRVQLTTDGHKMYLEAVEQAFGGDIDYAMLIKLYGKDIEGEKRYSPAECTGTQKRKINGKPDMKAVSTSYVERQNLTMRMQMRRFTRLTNAFSKKLENHILALALYFMYYNFARPHKSLANPYPTTPAMASGISTHIWTVEEIVKLV